MILSSQLLLIGAVAAVGVLHTMVPDHWVPITVIARQRGWSRSETARSALQAGTGHVLSTLAIAILVWIAGRHGRQTPRGGHRHGFQRRANRLRPVDRRLGVARTTSSSRAFLSSGRQRSASCRCTQAGNRLPHDSSEKKPYSATADPWIFADGRRDSRFFRGGEIRHWADCRHVRGFRCKHHRDLCPALCLVDRSTPEPQLRHVRTSRRGLKRRSRCPRWVGFLGLAAQPMRHPLAILE